VKKAMPVKPTEFCREEALLRKFFVRQGRLSRHKVSVGEPADGSPPKYFSKEKLLEKDLHSI
jgi:hypothetical protein